MNDFRQVLQGVIAALFSSALVFGSLALAMMEGGVSLALAPSPTQTMGPSPTVNTPRPGEPTFTPSPTPQPSATPTPNPSNCAYPSDWQAVNVLPGDTLADIAAQHGISLDRLLDFNCLPNDKIPNGVDVYVPPPPTPTPTLPTPTFTATPHSPTPVRAACNPPRGWIVYIVRSGDNLFRIGQTFGGVSVSQLMAANCLTSINIITGQRLLVPNVPTRTPVMTSTPHPTATALPPTGTTLPPSPTHTSPPGASPTPSDTPPPPPASPTPTQTLPPPATPTPTSPPQPTSTTAPSEPTVPPTATSYPTPVIQPTATPPDGP